jgi:hypothetical protein
MPPFAAEATSSPGCLMRHAGFSSSQQMCDIPNLLGVDSPLLQKAAGLRTADEPAAATASPCPCGRGGAWPPPRMPPPSMPPPTPSSASTSTSDAVLRFHLHLRRRPPPPEETNSSQNGRPQNMRMCCTLIAVVVHHDGY